MRTRFLLVFPLLAASTALAQKHPDKPVVLTEVPKVLAPHVQRALGAFHLQANKFSEDLGAFEITSNCKDAKAVAVLVGVSKGKEHTFRLFNCADASLMDTSVFTAADAAKARGIPAGTAKAWTQALARCGQVLDVLPPAPPAPPLVTASADEVKQAEARAREELTAVTPSLPPPPPPPDDAAREAEAKRAEDATRAEKAEAARKEEEAAKAAAAAKATPPPTAAAPKAEPPKATAAGPSAQASGMSAMRASIAARTFNRIYDYGGNASSALSTYNMNMGGAVAVDLVWYPGAHFVNNPLAHIGAFVQGDVALGLTSVRNGDTFGTHAERFRTGVIFRIPVSSFELDLHGGYLSQTFGVDTTGQAGGVRPNLPSVAYQGPRGGLDLRFKFSERVSANLAGGFTWCVGLGELADARFFPNATALGVDANVGLGVMLVPSLELRLTADYSRYMVTVGRGSTFRADSAADQYFGGNLGFVWVM